MGCVGAQWLAAAHHRNTSKNLELDPGLRETQSRLGSAK